MKKAILVFISAMLVCAAIVPVAAERRTNWTPSPEPEKTYCTATIDDDFRDDHVIVIFDRATSRKLLDYSPEDFPEIDCVEVSELMPYTKAQLKEMVAIDEVTPYERYYNKNDGNYYSQLDIEFDTYYQGILITLANPGKQNVLDAIKLLEKRENVLSATPDAIVYSAGGDHLAGDANGDGEVNSRDVIELMKDIVANKKISDSKKYAADINCDGKINSKDVILLMKKVVNGSVVTGDTSLYCRIHGHKLTASYAKETVHNAYAASPHCVQNTYLVISCGREGCGHIEKILVSSKRIANCHG